jgi:hypothetical protein
MADFGYVQGKLGAAILGMMQSTESLQDRLAKAWTLELALTYTLHTASLPSDMGRQFKAIMEAVTSKGPVVATTKQMSDGEASRIIEKIFLIYDDVREAYVKTT